MKCAVAIVLALIGMVVTSPVPSSLGYGYGYGLASPMLLPSAVSVSSSVINHGYTVPRMVVTAPIIRPVITPVIAAPIIRPVVTSVVAPVSTWGGYGYGGYGLGGWGYGKGWH